MMNKILEDLMEKFKKNSKLNAQDKKTFETELLKELNKDNFTDDLKALLCTGPVQESMDVLADYLSNKKMTESISFLEQLIVYGKKEKIGSFIFRMVYLYCFLNNKVKGQNELVEKVFLAMVDFSYKNGNNELNKNAIKLMRNNIIPIIMDGQEISLAFANEKEWFKIRDLFMGSVLEEKKTESKIVYKIYHWLESANRNMGKYSEKYLEDLFSDKNSIKSRKKSDDVITVKKKKISNSKGKKTKGNNGIKKLEEKIETLINSIAKNEETLSDVKSEIAYIKQKSNATQVLLDDWFKKQIQQETIINNLMEDKSHLQKSNGEYIEKIENLEKSVGELKIDNEEKKQLYESIVKNREIQAEEKVNKLASKLKVDYMDYSDAKNLKMTIDLGENMRDQLGAVFLILEKNGIKFD